MLISDNLKEMEELLRLRDCGGMTNWTKDFANTNIVIPKVAYENILFLT